MGASGCLCAKGDEGKKSSSQPLSTKHQGTISKQPSKTQPKQPQKIIPKQLQKAIPKQPQKTIKKQEIEYTTVTVVKNINKEISQKHLGVTYQNSQDFEKVKKAYRKKMIEATENRSTRIQLNVAYMNALQFIFMKKSIPLLVAIAKGENENVKTILKNDRSLLNSRIQGYPPLYYAVRSGHIDIVTSIIDMGCQLSFENDKSTPMHCAAFYGHRKIIPILLAYGVSTNIKNFNKNFPIQQSANDEIKALLSETQTNKILNLHLEIHDQTLNSLSLFEDSSVVVKKIFCKSYKNDYKNYQDAFHGTSFHNIKSIVKNGLKKQGDLIKQQIIKIVDGHINPGVQFRGKKNWSTAVFVSPSVYYASHYVYAKEFISENTAWMPILHVKVKKGCQQKFEHTLCSYNFKDKEPVHVQWRIQNNSNKEVVVVAIIFIKKGYLDQKNNYQETTKFILTGPDAQ